MKQRKDGTGENATGPIHDEGAAGVAQTDVMRNKSQLDWTMERSN